MKLLVAFIAWPWLCDWNWWRGEQLLRDDTWLGNGLSGISYTQRECRVAVGLVQSLADESLAVTPQGCGLHSHGVCRPLGADELIRAWRIGRYAWEYAPNSIGCEPRHSFYISPKVTNWCVSTSPDGCR